MPAPVNFSLGPSGFYYKNDGSGPFWLDTSGVMRMFQGDPLDALSSSWAYVPPTLGIVNTTTAVTIKAAAGAGVRNYLSGFQLACDALAAATEFAIRDGAGGPVLWRIKLATALLGPTNIQLLRPIAGSANTLLEVVTLTATVTGGVFFNAQGFAA